MYQSHLPLDKPELEDDNIEEMMADVPAIDDTKLHSDNFGPSEYAQIDSSSVLQLINLQSEVNNHPFIQTLS